MSDINSSNTDIRILPYIDSNIGKVFDFKNYNLSWNTTRLTEYELEIQLYFENPDLISRYKIYDVI